MPLRKPGIDLRDEIKDLLQYDDLLEKFYAHDVIRDLSPRRRYPPSPTLDSPAVLEDKIAECKARIARWYLRGTARLAESQARYEQYVAFLIGLMLALCFNIDFSGLNLPIGWKLRDSKHPISVDGFRVQPGAARQRILWHFLLSKQPALPAE